MYETKMPDPVHSVSWEELAQLTVCKLTNHECKHDLNPRLTKGIVATPLRFFPGRSKTLKKVTRGIKLISFTSFAVTFMKKKIGGTTLPGGRVSLLIICCDGKYNII